MRFYSALRTYKILQNCLRDLEKAADPDDIAVIRLKRALLIRMAELKPDAPRTDVDREVGEI